MVRSGRRFFVDVPGVGIPAIDTLLRPVMRIMGDASSMILLFVVPFMINLAILSRGPIRNTGPVASVAFLSGLHGIPVVRLSLRRVSTVRTFCLSR